MPELQHDLMNTTPIWVPMLGMLLVLLAETIQPQHDGRISFFITVLCLAVALVRSLEPTSTTAMFGGTVAMDPLSRGFHALILSTGVLVTLSMRPYFRQLGLPTAEAYACLLASISGMMLVIAARDLIVFFLGIELLSIPLYVLAAYRRLHPNSVESGFKYFLIGAFASSFLIYGIALMYGASGSTSYSELALAMNQQSALMKIGLGLLLIGLAFKVAAAPLHSWAPDVYQGAPTPISGFMAAAVKTAAFGGMLRLALEVLPAWHGLLGALSAIAAMTMIIGNLGALLQTNLKRLLAYSSIAHAGYLLVGIAAAVVDPRTGAPKAVLFYLFTYAVMTLGAFTALIFFLRDAREGEEISTLNGLSRSHPWLAFAMALSFFSMAGFPLTAGFFGKLGLLQAAWQADLKFLSIVLILTSVIALYYYLRVVVAMYMRSPIGERRAPLQSTLLSAVSVTCAVAIIVLGLYPAPLLDWLL